MSNTQNNLQEHGYARKYGHITRSFHALHFLPPLGDQQPQVLHYAETKQPMNWLDKLFSRPTAVATGRCRDESINCNPAVNLSVYISPEMMPYLHMEGNDLLNKIHEVIHIYWFIALPNSTTLEFNNCYKQMLQYAKVAKKPQLRKKVESPPFCAPKTL